MASSGDDEVPVKHCLYRDNPEWKDVTPLEVEDDPEPVVKIAYTEAFRDCFGYLRAVIRSGEISERVFNLTTTCVDKNPSCYTVWLLRRQLIQKLGKDIRHELQFMEQQILDNQKNYQVWYHRQKLIEWLGEPTGELAFIGISLAEDAKNYHAWQYRQWVVQTFDLWANELDFCHQMLQEDCRNNSAWNQRHFVVTNTSGFSEPIVDRELNYAMDSIRKVSRNESAWNYLNGVLDHATAAQKASVLAELQVMRTAGEQSVFLFSALLAMLESQGDTHAAQEVVQVLKKEDVPRTRYWAFRENLLLQAGAATAAAPQAPAVQA